MRIKLGPKETALARGITASAKVREQIDASDGDYEARVAFFWLGVGMAMAQEEDLDMSDPSLQEFYVRGASANAPAKRKQLPVAAITGYGIRCGHEGCNAVVDTLKEEGYSRTWRFSYDAADDIAIAWSKGLTDYSENGDDDHVAVCTAGHENEVPFEDWDYR